MLKKEYHAKGITKADRVTQASANLIKQDFTAALPNQKWPFTGEQSFVLKRLVPALKRIKLTQ
ncbi:MAG: hypothetical protein WA131_09670 [Desulfitobacteriaceae bacterium]